MKSLTKAEEQVMHVLWNIKEGFLGDIVEKLSSASSSPHRNTVATVIKVLIQKKFIGTRLIGRNYLYYPLVSKDYYSKASLKSIVQKYFDGSFNNVLSFMMKEKRISVEELEIFLKQVKDLEKIKK